MAQRQRRPGGSRPRSRLSVDVAAGDPPSEFRIFRSGINKSEKGEFLFDAEAGASVMREYEQHGKTLLFDFNHSSTLYDPMPEQAIAAGQFTPAIRDGDLWATDIRWTERASKLLSAREYRCFSPYFESDPKTGRILRLINIALTNLPALDGIEPLIAANANEGEPMDEWKRLYEEAKVKLDALEAEAKELRPLGAEVKELRAKLSAFEAKEPDVTAAVALRAQVRSITGKDSDATAIGALTALKEQATEVIALRAKVAEAETKALSAEWGAHLDGLSTKGKDGKYLPPGKRATAEKMALSLGGGTLTKASIEAAKEYVGEMMIAGDAPKPPPEGVGSALTEQRRKLAKLAGSSAEAVMKWEADQAAKQAAGG